ncbi:MAG TPA: hypothetical protein VN229_25310 [Terriglobales bacterium]|nr:hypothetical protein [Terriglobales bacterium]
MFENLVPFDDVDICERRGAAYRMPGISIAVGEIAAFRRRAADVTEQRVGNSKSAERDIIISDLIKLVC